MLAIGASACCEASLCCGLVGRAEFLHDVALVDPYLDAYGADRCLCGRLAVIDVSAQRVQRDTTLQVPLAPTHVCATEAAGRLDADSFGAGFERGRDGAFQRAAERNSAFELIGNTTCKQRCVELRIVNFDHIELDSSTGQSLKSGTEALCLRTASTDDNTRATRVDINLNLGAADTLDIDP